MAESLIETSMMVDDSAVLDAYQEAFAALPDFVASITSETVNEVGEGLLSDLRREPGAVKTPVRWTSLKQRRFVMAQRRRSGPYERSHRLSQGWKIQIVYDPNNMNSITVTNDAPEFPYVEGGNQQGYHADTGWPYAPDVIKNWTQVMRDAIETDVIKGLYAIGDPDLVTIER